MSRIARLMSHACTVSANWDFRLLLSWSLEDVDSQDWKGQKDIAEFCQWKGKKRSAMSPVQSVHPSLSWRWLPDKCLLFQHCKCIFLPRVIQFMEGSCAVDLWPNLYAQANSCQHRKKSKPLHPQALAICTLEKWAMCLGNWCERLGLV